ncbi:transglycosylase domain-containing protein [Frigoribacterium sp. 2-23]|uniref:transglycosylase domain-containing protein n=1 Tax=Frigoribacterium sp. 2-23 TaxID=3415006 RepID=UPI003C705E2A
MSAQKSKPTSVIGALFGFIGFSVLAGLLVTIGVTPAIAVAGMTASSSIGVFESIPEYIELGKLQQRNTLYATSNGQQVPFATLYSENRVEVGWDEVSKTLKEAVVAGEDRRFYEHGGVDVTSLVRAGVGTVDSGQLGASGGGSTLTMQLVRNILIAQSQQLDTKEERDAAYKEATDTSIERKLQEMKFAIGLEKKYSKDEILLAYLNIAYFGDQTYGIQAAAQHYYNKGANDLSAAEAASLIAIVQYPDTRNLSKADNYPANKARRDVILKSMYNEKYIDKETYDASVAADVASYVVLTPATQGCAAVTAPGAQFFCDYVKNSIGDLTSLGATPDERKKNWATGGYEVFTTLNLDLTANAKAQIDKYAPNTESRFDLGSAVNSVEAGTGRVIVMAQNKDFTEDPANTDPTKQGVNFSTDQNYGSSTGFQSGSTYKPFTLIDWLEKGHGINEQIDATKRGFSTFKSCGGTERYNPPYTPGNDEGNVGGMMSAYNATKNSVNVAYISMAQKLDLCDIRDVAQRLGVHRADGGELKYGAASVLGTNEVAPLTMAAAYAGIAANGKFCSPIIVDDIKDANGTSIGGQPQNCSQAISPDIAAAAQYAMQSPFQGGTITGGLPDSYPEIGKTGTTDGAKQIWLIGSTTKLATALWIGNIQGSASLRKFSAPGTNSTYANNRPTYWRAIQKVNNTVYPGDAFSKPEDSLIRGSGVSVPDLAGSTPSAAQTILSGLQLKYADGGTRPSALPAGQVSETDPGVGSVVSKGDTVTVYTSDGSLAATVPDVTKKSFKDARNQIAGAGFDPSKVSIAGFQPGDGKNQCQVISSNPGANSSVAKDSGIGLTIYGDKAGADPGNCA